MTRIASLTVLAAIALFTASCGCKQPIKPPALRSMPSFQEIPSAEYSAPAEVPVVPTK